MKNQLKLLPWERPNNSTLTFVLRVLVRVELLALLGTTACIITMAAIQFIDKFNG